MSNSLYIVEAQSVMAKYLVMSSADLCLCIRRIQTDIWVVRSVGKPPTLKSSDHLSRGKREIIIKTVMASLSFCKRSWGRISNTKISNIWIKLIIIFMVTLLMNMCLVTYDVFEGLKMLEMNHDFKPKFINVASKWRVCLINRPSFMFILSI
jgi:hypothetical protein